jgi:hypothetical protein
VRCERLDGRTRVRYAYPWWLYKAEVINQQ